MAIETTQHIDWVRSWSDSSGTYLTENWSADMTVTIADDYSQLTTLLTNIGRNPEVGSSSGNGFINASGIYWNPSEFYNSYVLQDVAYDTFTDCWNQLFTANPALSETLIFGVAVNDQTLETETRQGTSWQSYTFPLSGIEQLESGVLVIGAWSRWYMWEGEGGSELPERYSICQSDASFDIVYPDSSQPEVLDYYPWAFSSNGVWVSCNSSGHGLHLYSGGWADRTNNLLYDDRDTVWNREAEWTKAPLIGE